VGEAPTPGIAYATVITSNELVTSVEQYHIELPQ